MRLTKAQANNVNRFNWPAADGDYTAFKLEYRELAKDDDDTNLFLAVNGNRYLSPASAERLWLDMELIISRAEDTLDTTLFCGEVREAIGDRAVLRSMLALETKLKKYLNKG